MKPKKETDIKGWPRGDAGVTREKLLHAARDLFNSVGYHHTDTNKIARAAGYSPAMFYKHFEDKTAIFVEVYKEWVHVEWDGIRAAAAGRSSPEARRKKLLKSILEHHCRWREFRKGLRTLSLTDPKVWKARMAQREIQSGYMSGIADALGGKNQTAAQRIFLQFTIERICDAIADGEPAAMSITDDGLFKELEGFVSQYLASTRKS